MSDDHTRSAFCLFAAGVLFGLATRTADDGLFWRTAGLLACMLAALWSARTFYRMGRRRTE